MAVSPTIADLTIPYDASAAAAGTGTTYVTTYDLNAILEPTGGGSSPCEMTCE